MNGQSITLVIAGKEYKMTAVSPQMERYMRIAASEVNNALESLQHSFSEEKIEDKLAVIAVREAVSKLMIQTELSELKEGIKALDDSLAAYLKGEEI